VSLTAICLSFFRVISMDPVLVWRLAHRDGLATTSYTMSRFRDLFACARADITLFGIKLLRADMTIPVADRRGLALLVLALSAMLPF